MKDAGSVASQVVVARLARGLDEQECRRRNALSQTRPGLRLSSGDEVSVLETFGSGEAFLVEFGSRSADRCDWLGVLYPTEIEIERRETLLSPER